MTTSDNTLRQMISVHPRKRSIPSYAWSFAGKHLSLLGSGVDPQAIWSAHEIWAQVVSKIGGQFLSETSVSEVIASDDTCRAEYDLSDTHKKYVNAILNFAIEHYNALLTSVLDGELVPLPSSLIEREAYDAWCATLQGQPQIVAGDKSSSEVSVSTNETHLMALIREGRAYWWGDLDPETEYRADNQSEVRRWFVNRGADETDAQAFAKAIAPQWFLKGGRRDNKKQVPKRDFY